MSRRARSTVDASACKETGKLVPIISTSRCEAKEDCLAVCPKSVFEVRTLTADERAALGWLTRVKVRVHGGKQAFVVHPEACASCAACVSACPEKAIRLATVGAV